MRQITDINEIKQLQMEILTFVDKFCRDNNINYSLCGGTLIGAIRHGGYIPWDDDIDIMLLRPEYDRFVELFSKQQSQYKVHTFDNTTGYYQPYAMVSDMRTLLEEKSLKANLGVNIDVFPVDYAPDNENELKIFLKEIRRYYNYFVITGLKWSSKRSLTKNLFMFASQIVLCPFSRISFSKKIDKLARTAVNKVTNTIGILVWGYGAKEIIPASVFDSFQDIKFENKTFRSITDYDTYLTHVYGDYMQLPPVERRVAHHGFKAWWKD